MSEANSLPYNTITPVAARAIYTFQLSSQVARLFLYLFGEFDKDTVDAVTKKMLNETPLIETIVSKQKPPLRAIYDQLVELGLIEDQQLGASAMLYIDLPDNLQARIYDPENPSKEWQKIHSNSVLEGAVSPHTVLYKAGEEEDPS